MRTFFKRRTQSASAPHAPPPATGHDVNVRPRRVPATSTPTLDELPPSYSRPPSPPAFALSGQPDDDDPLVPRISRRATLAPANASELPAYSVDLARNELRLISTVHVLDSHPAAAFINAQRALHEAEADGEAGADAAGRDTRRDAGPDEAVEMGSKKLRVTLTRGGVRPNANGTGPVSIRLKRGGSVEGHVTVGMDRCVSLEVAIVGLVSTSYYVRGQYNVSESSPLVSERVALYPPTARDAPVEPVTDESSFIEPGTSFPFAVRMPQSPYDDPNGDLPPSCELIHLGLQTAVEYYLRIKLGRSKWRVNETIRIPLRYDVRAYISPRRLRSLTLEDPMNPGWRTIRLKGGEAVSTSGSVSGAAPSPCMTPGVQVTLLVPSPPIVFIADPSAPPPLPFHLHVYSTSALPLATFSDPALATFTARLVRISVINFGTEKQYRRVEVPARAELWGEAGARVLCAQTPPELDPHAHVHPRTPRSPHSILRRISSDHHGHALSLRPSSSSSTSAAAAALPAPALAARSLSATDVHLVGQLTLTAPTIGQLKRQVVQSFHCRELVVGYVLEVAIRPKAGAVREAFGHVWGGGMVEVVWA
ncbi:hypothetical protein Q5752_001794 [Cryptotrichosporon argae]